MKHCVSRFAHFAAIIYLALATNCFDKHCSLRKNDKNEVVFDCSTEKRINSTDVECSYISHKIILSTTDSKYVSVDKIVSGAFSRLVAGRIVNKIYINKLQFKSLDQNDFHGLSRVSEMQIENPKKMSSDTFLSLATRTKFFILTISCIEGNTESSFELLLLMSHMWKLNTKNCGKRLSCEYSTCGIKSGSVISKIIPYNTSAPTANYIEFRSCSPSSTCINDELTIAPTTVNITKPPMEIISTKPTLVAETKSEEYQDMMMYLVLIISSINSFVIFGILIFLIFWWKKISSSKNNTKKHTIILTDEEDIKYLNYQT